MTMVIRIRTAMMSTNTRIPIRTMAKTTITPIHIPTRLPPTTIMAIRIRIPTRRRRWWLYLPTVTVILMPMATIIRTRIPTRT